MEVNFNSSHLNPHNNEWFNFNEVIQDRQDVTRDPAEKLFLFISDCVLSRWRN